jgi:molybdopterin converting factor small subunit
MNIIRVPSPLRPYTDGTKEVAIDAKHVGGALEELTLRFPQLKPHLFDDVGKLRSYVNVFVNDNNMRDLQSEATPLADGDRLIILPSIAGGSTRHARIEYN